RLPVDTHSTLAMIAPGGLLMMDNPRIDWLAASSSSVGALGGAEVYKALGAEGNITYWSDVQDGNHCASRSEWRGPNQQSIQKFLRNSGSYTGSLRISPAKRGDLAEWRDWQTPDLSGSNPGDTTPPTAPTGLTASGTTATGTSLSWTASTDDTGVTGYDILRAPATGAFTQVGTSATTPYTATGLTPETAYRYQVRARDAAGNTSAVSNTVQITTEPGSPSGGTCTAVQTVQTQWGTGYVIQPLTITNTGSATVNGWTVTFTLPAGHTLTGSWNGVVTTSGQTVTIRNVAHNGALSPGASTSVGFRATRPDGDSALPSGYTCA